jgi:hypothetical protein
MTVAPGFRAVVFALRDLLPGDKRYITEVAHALRFAPEREPALWDTPLLLGRQSDTPPVPGLRTDSEVAAGGSAVLLLAMRLLLADALQWPELRFLGLDLHRDAPDYVLYAADPARWTPDSLAAALQGSGSPVAGTAAVTSAGWQIQRGLQPRPERLPPVPGDRVPVLGLQVPMFGGRLANLRDLRPLAERRRLPLPGAGAAPPVAADPAGTPLPAAALPGHHQGRYALFLHLEESAPHEDADPESDATQVELRLFRHDRAADTMAGATLQLGIGDLQVLHDAEAGQLTPAAVSDWLAELLPSCFLVAPTGEVLLLDWFGLELALCSPPSPALAVRSCRAPSQGSVADSDDQAPADPTLLDPALWSLPVLADLIAAADLTLSSSGRYLRLESTVPVDGELTHLSALLDTHGPVLLSCDLGDEPCSPLASPPDDPFPPTSGADAAPGAIA